MVKKHFTLRLTAVSFLTFLSLFLASFSCQDHEPEPPRIFPVINTLNVVRTNDEPSFQYSVQFQELGNQQIAEYGVVTYAGSANENPAPTIQVVNNVKGRKYDFSGPGYMPPSLDVKSIVRQYDGPAGQIRLFYRAYARLADNSVVYGQVKFVDFSIAPQLAEITTGIVAQSPSPTPNVTFTMTVDEVGNVPVVNYGVLCVFRPLPYNGPIIEPGFADVKIDFDKPFVNGQINHTFNYNPNAPERVFFRAYAILENGTIVFGNTKFTDLF
ncbi:hypothetical protein [Dyadobacter bucti]|uniref:hypothetical protein n=1 Tax=Dyadobacter bucti TaxID=2572203 RepID=UPI00110907AE|nr:hypothetical protein [Dyadobacter bucti]